MGVSCYQKRLFYSSSVGEKKHIWGILLFFYQWRRFVQAKYSVNILVHRADILLDGIDVLFVVIFIGSKAARQAPQGGCTYD